MGLWVREKRELKAAFQRLGITIVDLEKIITKRMNLSAREIFERFGEPYYRALETLALKQLIQDSERKVISLGAGLPLQEQNEKYLRELGTVVYLKDHWQRSRNVWRDPKKIRCWMGKTEMTRSRNF